MVFPELTTDGGGVCTAAPISPRRALLHPAPLCTTKATSSRGAASSARSHACHRASRLRLARRKAHGTICPAHDGLDRLLILPPTGGSPQIATVQSPTLPSYDITTSLVPYKPLQRLQEVRQLSCPSQVSSATPAFRKYRNLRLRPAPPSTAVTCTFASATIVGSSLALSSSFQGCPYRPSRVAPHASASFKRE